MESVKNKNQISDFCSNKKIPILFANDCETNANNGQMEPFTLVLSRFKLILLQCKSFALSTTVQLFKEYHIFDIRSIFFVQKNQYNIILKNGKMIRITANNFEKAVNIIIDTVQKINYNAKRPIEITFGGFSNQQSLKKLNCRPDEQAILRYMAYCDYFNCEPNQNYINDLSVFEKVNQSFICLTKKIEPIYHPDIIAYPLITENTLAIVQLNGICPNISCRIVHCLLKYSQSLSTIIFEEYPKLNVDQLGFEKIKNPSVVSWHFRHCFFEEKQQIISLMEMFRNYQNGIQTFQLDNVAISSQAANKMVDILTNSRCFKTLEILNLINLEISEYYVQEIFDLLTKTVSVLPSLMHYGFTCNWSTIIQVNQLWDTKTSSLQSLILTGSNATNIPIIYLPESLTNLEFNECFVTSFSLINILKSVAMHPHDISLVLHDFILDKKFWDEFQTNFVQLEPFTNLIELDWSGNPIPESFQKDFQRILLNPDKIKYLNISRIFTTCELSRLTELIDYLSGSHLWGLDIEGSESDENYQYGDAIIAIVLQLSKISTLEHLNLNYHYFSKETFDMLIATFKNDIKMLHEILMDGTGISTPVDFLDCYIKMFESLAPRQVLRPKQDIKRLGIQIDSSEKYNAFRSAMLSTHNPSTRLMRSSYYHFSSELNPGFEQYMNRFSQTTNLNISEDKNYLTPFDSCQPRSLRQRDDTPYSGPFGVYQTNLIKSPYADWKPPPNLGQVNAPFETPPLLEQFAKYKPVIDKFYIDDPNLIQADQVYEIYKKFATPTFLKLLNDIEKIKEIFQEASESNEFDDSLKPPLFVSKAAIDKMRDIIDSQMKSRIPEAGSENDNNMSSNMTSDQSLESVPNFNSERTPWVHFNIPIMVKPNFHQYRLARYSDVSGLNHRGSSRNKRRNDSFTGRHSDSLIVVPHNTSGFATGDESTTCKYSESDSLY